MITSADKMLKEFSCHSIFRCQCIVHIYPPLQKEIPQHFDARPNFLKKLDNELVISSIKTKANLPRTGIPISVQAVMTSHRPPPLQVKTLGAATARRQGKEIGVHCAQGRKTLGIVLNVLYTLHFEEDTQRCHAATVPEIHSWHFHRLTG